MSTRSRTGITTLDCGCKHSDRAWTHECDAHRRAENQHHIQASVESGRKPRPSAIRAVAETAFPAVVEAWNSPKVT